MLKNRSRRVQSPLNILRAHFGREVRRSLPGLAILTLLVALGAGGWALVRRSSYFHVRSVEATETIHLDRATIVALAGLDAPVNLFRYDTAAAEDALTAHPWVASARVEKRLPDRVEVHLVERTPAAILALSGLYMIDADGTPFIRTSPAQAGALPLVTGLKREGYDADPTAARALIREALALGRIYARHPLAKDHPLSNMHIGDGGRLELMLGRTRVVIGRLDVREKLDRLAQIYDTLTQRGMDATYILLDEGGQRAIVKEVPAVRPVLGSL